MKHIYFRRIKGRVNPIPENFYLSCEDNRVEENEKIVTLRFDGFLAFKRSLIFLKQYVFMQLDFDNDKLEIYMPKDYIHCVRNSPFK